MDIIKNPTQEWLDELLMEIIEKSSQVSDINKQYLNGKRYIEQIEDKEYSIVNEDGKPKHRYKTTAEATCKLDNSDIYDNHIYCKGKKIEFENELDTLKMVYYHAREKLKINDTIDIQASERGQTQDL